MGKKLAALVCAIMLAFGGPFAAFGDERADNGDQEFTGSDYSFAEGTLTGLHGVIYEGNNYTGGNKAQTIHVDPVKISSDALPGNVKAWKGKITGFKIWFGRGTTPDEEITGDVPPKGGTVSFTYNVNPDLIDDYVADGKPKEDLRLAVYEMSAGASKAGSQATKLKEVQASEGVSIDNLPACSHTLAMVLVDAPKSSAPVESDTQAKPEPKGGSGSGSDGGWGYDPVEMPEVLLVHTGLDNGDTSPVTGQSGSAQTAPFALAIAGVLGGATIVAARRRTR